MNLIHIIISTVKAIPTSKIVSQYGGKNECAYMLIYRKKDLSPIKCQFNVPEYLLNEILVENSELQKEREEIERKTNTIQIIVLLEDYYQIGSDQRLHLHSQEQTEEIGDLFEPIDESQIPHTNSFTISLNKKDSIEVLLGHIKLMLDNTGFT